MEASAYGSGGAECAGDESGVAGRDDGDGTATATAAGDDAASDSREMAGAGSPVPAYTGV
jgi:hypothetical protein